MARRKNSDEPAVNLDSLMDALTNVGGALSCSPPVIGCTLAHDPISRQKPQFA
ncbi:MAG: hypothetical protein MUF13_17495 [Akkermansiaceae bacterium]|nr:hypothetical protein [Akkermansiaceae bacterium]